MPKPVCSITQIGKADKDGVRDFPVECRLEGESIRPLPSGEITVRVGPDGRRVVQESLLAFSPEPGVQNQVKLEVLAEVQRQLEKEKDERDRAKRGMT